jgi:hypothetical protein
MEGSVEDIIVGPDKGDILKLVLKFQNKISGHIRFDLGI